MLMCSVRSIGCDGHGHVQTKIRFRFEIIRAQKRPELVDWLDYSVFFSSCFRCLLFTWLLFNYYNCGAISV